MYELVIVEGSGYQNANWLLILKQPPSTHKGFEGNKRSMIIDRFETREKAVDELIKMLDDLAMQSSD